MSATISSNSKQLHHVGQEWGATHMHPSPKPRRVLRIRPDRRVGAPHYDEETVQRARHAQPLGGGTVAGVVSLYLETLYEGVSACACSVEVSLVANKPQPLCENAEHTFPQQHRLPM